MKPEDSTKQPRGCNPEAVGFVPNEDNKPKKLTQEQRRRKREYEEKFPLLLGLVIRSQIVVFCAYCKGIHAHGWDHTEDPRTEELRYAHCKNREKFGGSYRVSPVPQEILKRIERGTKELLGIGLALAKLAPASRERAKAIESVRRAAKEGQANGN